MPLNSTNDCQANACVPVCNDGFADCDGNHNNGCEVDLNTATSCGQCDVTCTNKHGSTACVKEVCVPICGSGFGNCNADPVDGCEADLNRDLANCGRCGHPCMPAGADGICSAGACTIVKCHDGFANCDGDPRNGCETDLTTVDDCGSCRHNCRNEHGPSSCVSGGCAATPCGSGFADCDNNPDNGCETNINADALNCQTCGHACSAAGGTPNCVAGKCIVSMCEKDKADCNTLPDDGCEVSTMTDPMNCGACGHMCSRTNGTASCTGGQCMILCNDGFANCNSNPADGCETPVTTSANCGGCGTACSYPHAIASCDTGTCHAVDCTPGFDDCNMSTVDGCEAELQSDANNCGACGHPCENPHGPPSKCVLNVCTPTCDAGWAACGTDRGAGCTVDTSTDQMNCGSCGHVCSGGRCMGGACVDCPDTEPHKNDRCDTTVVCGPYKGAGPTACNCYCVNNMIDCREGTMSGNGC